MKLTKTKLKQIIKEELQKVLAEGTEEVLQEESPRDALRRLAKKHGGLKGIMKLDRNDADRQAYRAAYKARKSGAKTVDFAGLKSAGMATQQALGLRGGEAGEYAELPAGVRPGDVLGALRAGVGKVLRPNEIQFDKGSVVFADDDAKAKAMAYLDKLDPEGKLFGGPERIQRAIAGAAADSPALRNILRKDQGEIAAKMQKAMSATGEEDRMMAPRTIKPGPRR
jgi:hypothetical protein